MAKRFKRYEPEPDRQPEDDEGGQFSLERKHERRILSWSPEPEDEFVDEPPALTDEVQQQAHVAAERQSASVPKTWPEPEPLAPPSPVREVREEPMPVASPPPVPVPAEVAKPEPPPLAEVQRPARTEDSPRRRGRPRGRPRRQVHFHVDPDEELLLLAASRKHGSQQKGLVAALQALQDIELLRDEIERLKTECERQRVLLADAEAIFRR